MKNEIINLLQTAPTIKGGNRGINARDIHRLLKVGRDYSKWITSRIKQAGFIESQDFEAVENGYFLRDKTGKQKETRGGHNRFDYVISLDMAKHLCLMEKNDIGRAIRQHFIEAESQLRQVAPKVYRNTLAQTQARLASIDHNREMTDAIKENLNRNAIPYKPFYYSREQEMLDSLVLGQDVRKWKAQHAFNGNIRDYFSTQQLEVLKKLQTTNTALISLGMNYHERKGRLSELVERL